MIEPTAAEMAAAVEAGAPVHAGRPAFVRLADGGFAALNLVDALAGRPSPWTVVRRRPGGLLHIATATDAAFAFDGYEFPPETWGLLLAALEAAPHDAARHDPNADAARTRAGQICLRIANNMARARALDAVDGWAAVLGKPVDDGGPSDGQLFESADAEFAARVRLLRVVCPSTARVYVLRVPAATQTAAAARRWTMGLASDAPAPDVET